ncbi:MAG TPA: threonine synthase [Vicinamibacteria bacterium]|nr:threonine synthase [Vicinamibacteria bacterium]
MTTRYLSTNGKAARVDLGRALFSGPAPDGGLYVPERVSKVDIDELRGPTFADTASRVAALVFGRDLPADVIEQITRDSFPFEVPLVRIEDGIYVLELFHGPTLAFKDIGARFLARLMQHFTRSRKTPATVLVATSGDTGSAVGHAFHRLPGFRVFVLFPRGRVSDVQRRLFTTLGGNVLAVSVNGTFDDCQRLVKQAFSDERLTHLVSANSINLGRLLPQTFYYFHIVPQWRPGESFGVSIPSGNFGNLTAGLLAKKMGLPATRFVAATNMNDVVPEYLRTGRFQPRSSVATLSSAMDVGDPSNFARILWLYGGSLDALRRDVEGSAHTDDETLEAMRWVHRRTGYILDPHSAVGYIAARRARERTGEPFVLLATAHPAKFAETVARAIGEKIELPTRLAALNRLEEKMLEMNAHYGELYGYLK